MTRGKKGMTGEKGGNNGEKRGNLSPATRAWLRLAYPRKGSEIKKDGGAGMRLRAAVGWRLTT